LEGGLLFFGGGFWKKGKRRRRKLEGKIVLGNFYRGTVVAGNFGLGGQETARIPGAREPERLFLVGWEVNIQFQASIQASISASFQQAISAGRPSSSRGKF
jgi:hypothetical protein